MTKQQHSPLKFAAWFVGLFVVFYYGNILFFGITSPGGHYSAFVDHYLNYIAGLRWLLLQSSAGVLNLLGYHTITAKYDLLVAGHGIIKLVYSCLGLGLCSFFAAFILAYPREVKAKVIFILSGIFIIQLLNVARFVLLALFWTSKDQTIDHHTIFNVIMYVIIGISLYFWVKTDTVSNQQNVAN